MHHTATLEAIAVSSHVECSTLVIEISDEGCGIPADALQRIFERFARVDRSRHRSGDGTGLGLAIVDAVAKVHGGLCTVESSPAGSTFGLRLPDFRLPAGMDPGRPTRPDDRVR